jgi:iron uptake system EfeUOB component EfeO/EfeM
VNSERLLGRAEFLRVYLGVGLPMRLTALCFALWVVAVAAAHGEPFDAAVEEYRLAMIENIGQALSGARDLRDALNRRDFINARKAWIGARVGWERSEVFTSGFVPDLDEAIDAWPDANAGFHGIEAKLFGADPADAGDQADALVAHLAELDARIRTMQLTPQGLFNGIVRLAYEVGDSKVDGGESRVSGTSLDDMRNNADGIDCAYRDLFAVKLEAADKILADRVEDDVKWLKALLAVNELRSVDVDSLRKASEAFIVGLQAAAPELGLSAPALEEAAK